MKTKKVRLIDEYSWDEFHIYGLWLIDLGGDESVEMAAAIGVQACDISTAKAAATWLGLLAVWFNNSSDWDGSGGGQELSEEQRDEALDILRGDVSKLMRQLDDRSC